MHAPEYIVYPGADESECSSDMQFLSPLLNNKRNFTGAWVFAGGGVRAASTSAGFMPGLA